MWLTNHTHWLAIQLSACSNVDLPVHHTKMFSKQPPPHPPKAVSLWVGWVAGLKILDSQKQPKLPFWAHFWQRKHTPPKPHAPPCIEPWGRLRKPLARTHARTHTYKSTRARTHTDREGGLHTIEHEELEGIPEGQAAEMTEEVEEELDERQ